MELLILFVVVIAVSVWVVTKIVGSTDEGSAGSASSTSGTGARRPHGSIWLSAAEADELLGHLHPGDELPIALKAGPGGLLPTSPEGKHLAPGNRHLTRLGLHWLNVRGSQHYEDERSQVVIRPGDRVALRREPENEYDSNAIAVQLEGLTLGYVNKGLARRLAKWLDAGEEYRAFALRLDPLSILIAKPEDLEPLGL